MTAENLTARYLAKYMSKGSAPPGPSSQPGLLQRDGLITTTELAEFLSLPAKTLRDWRYTGVGPRALRIGRQVRYEPAEVRRWLVEDCTRQRSA